MARLTAWLAAALAVTATHAFPATEKLAKLVGSGPMSADVDLIKDLHATLVRLRDERAVVKRSSGPVDVSGEHAFVAPSDGDQRGPCPGLNALANHNYISHDGVATIVDAVTAAMDVFSFGADLATVLALLSVVFVGNPVSLNPSFSIGGGTSNVENILDNLGGILGTPEGLDHSHNIIESDASLTRDDLYATGDAWTMNIDLFSELYASIQGDALTRDEAAAFAVQRYHNSIATNPFFWNGPVTNILMRPVGYVLVTDILSNHTDDNPDEKTSKDVLKSFYGVTELANGSLTYCPGHERIPSNWYPRASPYTIPDFNAGELKLLLKEPALLSIGGNTGQVNSFAGINPEDLTGGVFNITNLFEGNNLICFALEVVKFIGPNLLSSALKTLAAPIELLGTIVAPLVALDCPVFDDLTLGGTDYLTHVLNTYPGANMSGFAL